MLTVLALCAIALCVSILDNRSRESLRIGLLSDPHCSSADSESAARYAANFEKAVESVNREGVDCVVIAGDLVDEVRPGAYDVYRCMASRIERPVYVVPGNHDVGGKVVAGEDDFVTAEKVANYEANAGSSFWSEQQSGFWLIGINASLLGSGLALENVQWQFLKEQLAKHAGSPAIVVSHYPPFIDAVDEPGDRYWNIQPEPRTRLLSLLKRYGACAVLSGHIHRNLETSYEGIPLITTAPVSFGLPPGIETEGWMVVTVRRDGRVDVRRHCLNG